jgi:hypothetical protein
MKKKERMGARKRKKRKTPNMGPLVTNPKPYK